MSRLNKQLKTINMFEETKQGVKLDLQVQRLKYALCIPSNYL